MDDGWPLWCSTSHNIQQTKASAPIKEVQIMDKISDKWCYLLFVAVWAIVVAVADMNWPDHMGGGGHLMAALGLG